jgi:hypothetical protein
LCSMLVASTVVRGIVVSVSTLVEGTGVAGTGEYVGTGVGVAGFIVQAARIKMAKKGLIRLLKGLFLDCPNMGVSLRHGLEKTWSNKTTLIDLRPNQASSLPALLWELYFYHRTLRRANNPNPMMIAPEILLTHRKRWVLNLARNMPTPLLNRSHQKAEPVKTPRTKTPAEL